MSSIKCHSGIRPPRNKYLTLEKKMFKMIRFVKIVFHLILNIYNDDHVSNINLSINAAILFIILSH